MTRARELLYGAVIAWSAALLFVVQPMIARAILPWFGGSAGVWTAALLFFQCALLAGYAYAYVSVRRLSGRAQVIVHVSLLAASVLLLDPTPSAAWKPGAADEPAARIPLVLGAAVGLPFALLSATSPLLQHWSGFAIPHRLYAVANFAALAALLAYPFGIEPLLAVSAQLTAWSAGYAGFALLCVAAALWQAREAVRAKPAAQPLWILLPACSSALWMAATNRLTQDVAPVPLLWVLPFAAYLLSFVLAFARDGWPAAWMRWLLPVSWVGLAASGWLEGAFAWRFLPATAALFVCCLFLHAELAQRRPPAPHLAAYYLHIALGGALGGVFVGVAAPAVFETLLELPLAIGASMLLALYLIYGCGSPRRLARFAAAGAAALVLANQAAGPRVRARSFYGALQVRESAGRRVLYHGAIEHGSQFLDAGRSRWPTHYYGSDSGVGLALRHLRRGPMRVGVVGLGAGTLAAHAQPGDRYRFYEIDPQIVRFARSEFRFLSETAARVEIVTADARLALEREAPQQFDVLAVDAFSGDAIPVHLITREAFALYLRHLRPDGCVAVHITNKHLDLAPVIAAAARTLGREGLLVETPGDAAKGTRSSSWMLAAAEDRLAPLRRAGRHVPAGARPWTDDYSNLLGALK